MLHIHVIWKASLKARGNCKNYQFNKIAILLNIFISSKLTLEITLIMIFLKIIFLTIFSLNVFAIELFSEGKLSGVKRGANDPWFESQLNHLVKMLIKRKQYEKSLVVTKKIQNLNGFELRKILKRMKLGTKNNSGNIEPKIMPKTRRQNSRFNSYRRFHIRNQ